MADDADHYYPFGTEMFPFHLKGKQTVYDKGGDRKYENTYVCVFTFNTEGKICEYREYRDPIVTGVTYNLADVSYHDDRG